MASSRTLLETALNLSEGRRPDIVDLARSQAATAAAVLDVSADPDHNRTVLTLAGAPQALVEAVMRVAGVAVDNIDLGRHDGVHPRLGALDVVPFTPLGAASMAEAVRTARRCGRRLWEELQLPVFLYEQAAAVPEAGALPWVRRNAFTAHAPDFGGPRPHPTAGAVVVGARNLLVAYNIDLATQDTGHAISIAAEVRRRYPGRVRALGFFLPSRDAAQVSMNVLDPRNTTLPEIFSFVAERAGASGTRPLRSEVVGLVPRESLAGARGSDLAMPEDPKILEEVLDRLVNE